MMKPEWCPQDVWDVASEQCKTLFRDLSLPTQRERDLVCAQFARAILAERERIDDSVSEVLIRALGDGRVSPNTSRAILAAIRGLNAN